MSGNDPQNGGFSSEGQNDWHEQPTQGPHSPQQYGQQYGGAQPYNSAPQNGQQPGPAGAQPYPSQDQYAQQYGQQSQPYGQVGQQYGQPQPAYGQQYGQPYGQTPGLVAGHGQLASWGKRLGAYLIDALCLVPAWILLIIFVPKFEVNSTTGESKQVGGSIAITSLLYLISFAFTLWNLGYKQGKTGQSIGKSVLGLKVVGEHDGQPLGVGRGIGRAFCHMFIDGSVCLLGFLWPLWDAKKQTWGDKIVSSLVVDAPKN